MSDPRDALFSTPAMANLFSAESHVAHMLQFEAALARAEAYAGVIPPAAAEAIAAACQVERFDIAALYHEAATAGTVAIPLVQILSEQVGGAAGQYVHWGATSQDAIDTALVLQGRTGLDLLCAELLELCAACATLAEQHRHTLMAGRTLLQQALPIPFGLKAARWLALVARQVTALREQQCRALVLQFGGAAGTLAALGSDGLRVAELLAEELGLALPDLPWHAERDRVAAVTGALGITAGAMAKIAGDIVLLAQTEVGEVAEGAAPGKGGSSAMAHKRNPVDAVLARAAARQALGQVPVLLGALDSEHERAAGSWQAEWAAIPALFGYVAGAVAHTRSAVSSLEIDADRMRANLDLGGSVLMAEAVTMALARHLGRMEAQRVVRGVVQRVVVPGMTFRQALLAEAQVRAWLSEEAIDQALDPTAYLGSARVFIDRALATYHAVRQEEP